jgi:hypothetical protein
MSDCKTYLSEERIIVSDEFIAKNNLSLRPSKEIKEQYESVKKNDFFGFSGEVFTSFINWEDGKEYYKEEYRNKVDAGEEQFSYTTDIKEAAQDFLDYMNFAWGKAQDQRGISSSRSISKLSAWLWCMNRPDLSEEINRDDLYNPYGAPALISICDKMGITVPNSLREFANNPE